MDAGRRYASPASRIEAAQGDETPRSIFLRRWLERREADRLFGDLVVADDPEQRKQLGMAVFRALGCVPPEDDNRLLLTIDSRRGTTETDEFGIPAALL